MRLAWVKAVETGYLFQARLDQIALRLAGRRQRSAVSHW
jgi:hypothetical protein